MTKSEERKVDGEADHRKPVAKPTQVISKVDQNQLAQFVTKIKNAEQQVGEHIKPCNTTTR